MEEMHYLIQGTKSWQYNHYTGMKVKELPNSRNEVICGIHLCEGCATMNILVKYLLVSGSLHLLC